MKTRSQAIRESIQPLYSVEIDFDGASEAWKLNKKYQGNGTYTYRCMGLTKQGNPCGRKRLNECDFCKIHR